MNGIRTSIAKMNVLTESPTSLLTETGTITSYFYSHMNIIFHFLCFHYEYQNLKCSRNDKMNCPILYDAEYSKVTLTSLEAEVTHGLSESLNV